MMRRSSQTLIERAKADEGQDADGADDAADDVDDVAGGVVAQPVVAAQ